ncbi:DNA-binding helix-turn-helix protein [Lentilactobacillus kisonensis DSM 19906 = JCM 15041]|uniref:DNA-binding helix-turn-helix protein n=2 Tax=Lentilactobacillus kisonensis TaxID=481722 RepID=H1LK72_9LACO|nr:DNA-binding helix-turn-helix protein [Lentilactobacillus kisonensis F0435]KRL21652.1 DNA-binding helix-turn-helix protein [Lentilactobacillus kisonensis DSM 19906 = JCM 15041]
MEVSTIKNTIKDRRKKLKLSQADLSELTSVTRQTINAIENEKYDPSLSLAFKLARVLNTTVDNLFTEEGDYYGKD